MAEWKVENFERGITDNYIDAVRNKARTMDNLLIDRNRKVFSRSGSSFFDTTNSSGFDNRVFPIGRDRIQKLYEFKDHLFHFSANKVLAIFDGGSGFRYTEWSRSFSSGTFSFSSSSAWTVTSITKDNAENDIDQWQSHMYMSLTGADEYQRPRKMWLDEDSNFQIRTAGLPSPRDFSRYNKAVSLHNDMLGHFQSHLPVSVGHLSQQTFNFSSIPTVVDLDTLLTAVNILRSFIRSHLEDAKLSTPVYHISQTSSTDQDISIDTDATTLDGVIEILNELRSVYNSHDFDVIHTSTGTEQTHVGNIFDFPGVITVSSSDPSQVYIYNFVYKRQYKSGSITFIDRSTPWEFSVEGPPTLGGVNFIAYTSLDPLTDNHLGIQEIFIPAGVKLEIYRSELNGTIPKFVAEIDSTTTAYTDITPDASLGIDVYTAGGVQGTDIVPLCKYLTQTNDVLWYANLKEDSETRPFRVRQSIQSDPDGSPKSFFIDVDDDVTGISSVNIFPIVFTANKTYRLEGIVDLLGRGFTKKRIVDHTIGCIGSNSIVRVKEKIYFAGNDGFYMTDGFKVTKISSHLDDTYKAITETETQRRRIYGIFDQKKDLVYWSVTSESSVLENDVIYVHDIHWSYPNNEGTFTSFSGGENFKPCSLETISGDLVRADSRGFVFKHNNSLGTDLILDTSDLSISGLNNWDNTAVIYDYTSPAWSFGSQFQRKWVTKLLTTVKPVSNVSIQPQSINDDSQLKKNLKEVRERGVWTWGDPLFAWGDSTFAWRANPISNFVRRFPRDGLRCTYKQVRYTNAFTVSTSSDSNGSVVVDATLKTVTLSSGTWPTIDGDLISGEWIPGTDINATGFKIASQTTTVLTLSDPTNILVGGTITAWYAKQFIETELFYLNGYTVILDSFGTSPTYFNVGDSGEIGS